MNFSVYQVFNSVVATKVQKFQIPSNLHEKRRKKPSTVIALAEISIVTENKVSSENCVKFGGVKWN